MTINIEDCFVDIDGLCIHYKHAGEGQKLVIIPGFASTSESFVGIIDYLCDTMEVFVIDPAGFGTSSPLTKSGSYLQQASEVIAKTIKNLGIKNFVFFGYSMGATLILLTNQKLKEDVNAYILFEPYTGAQNLIMPKTTLRLLKAFSHFFSHFVPSSIGQRLWDSDKTLMFLYNLLNPIKEGRLSQQKLQIIKCADYKTFWQCLNELLHLDLLSTNHENKLKKLVLPISSIGDTINFTETVVYFKAIFTQVEVIDTKMTSHFPTHPLTKDYIEKQYPFLRQKIEETLSKD
jgi:pimeloyl-ACP methyl ester carboxylesterase